MANSIKDNLKTSQCKKSMSLRKWFAKHLTLLTTLGGVVVGIIEGFSLRPWNLSQDVIITISYPGELFMRMLKMLILPLLISSMITGAAAINIRVNGRIAIRALIYFALTSLFNACLGVFLALVIHPGKSEQITALNRINDSTAPSLMDNMLDLGRNLFPENLFQASYQHVHTVYVFNKRNEINGLNSTVLTRELRYRSGTNTLGIVFFCVIFGALLDAVGSKGQTVIDFFSAMFEVVMKMVRCAMWLTPFGISSVIAGKILSVNDLESILLQLMWFVITVAIGIYLYQWIFIQLIYFVFLQKNPFKFYSKLIQPMMVGAATSSSAAALPVTFRCMNEKLCANPRITQFILPIGCHINLDGTALFIPIATIFISQMSGITLGAGELVTILLITTIGTLSSAAIPSGAIVRIVLILASIGVPVHNVTLLLTIDWLLDRLRTTNNILGDCYACAIVEHLSQKELEISDDEMMLKQDTFARNNQN